MANETTPKTSPKNDPLYTAFLEKQKQEAIVSASATLRAKLVTLLMSGAPLGEAKILLEDGASASLEVLACKGEPIVAAKRERKAVTADELAKAFSVFAAQTVPFSASGAAQLLGVAKERADQYVSHALKQTKIYRHPVMAGMFLPVK